jgi:TRAP-type C4-dicarboxylate transport system permease small subunit
MRRVLDGLEMALGVLTGVLFSAVFVLTLTNIVSRNLGGVAIRWVPGMIRMTFIWSVLLAAVILYRRDDHLMVDFFIGKMSVPVRRIVQMSMDILTVPFFTLVVIHGVRISRVRMKISYETWKFPTGYSYHALPVAASLMLVINIERLKKTITSRQITSRQQRGM